LKPIWSSVQTVKQATLTSSDSLAIVATGKDAASAGDIHIIGSSLKAGDTLLLAKHAITLEKGDRFIFACLLLG
jgi:filamentous hemagglutinin